MGPGQLTGRARRRGRSPVGGDPPSRSNAGAGARQSRPRARLDRGFTTAETAVALPSLVIVALMLAWVVALVTAQLQCVDAARAGARAVSRGETTAASEAAALAAAPRGAAVEITRTGDFIRVRVFADIQPAGGLVAFLPTASVEGVAHAIAEDAVAAGTPTVPGRDEDMRFAGESYSRADSELRQPISLAADRPRGGRTVVGPRA